MIDWNMDNSYGLLGMWYTYTNLYLYLEYKHFEITTVHASAKMIIR